MAGKSIKQLESSVQTSPGALYFWQTSLTDRQEQRKFPYHWGNQLQQDLSWARVGKGACTPRSAPPQAESLIYFGPPNLTDTKECFVMFSSTAWYNQHAFWPLSRAQMLLVWMAKTRKPSHCADGSRAEHNPQTILPQDYYLLVKGWMSPKGCPSVQTDLGWRRNPGTTGI